MLFPWFAINARRAAQLSVERLEGRCVPAVLLVDRPIEPGKADLVVNGSAGNDSIQFSPGNEPGTVQVTVNGILEGTFAPTGRLVAGGLDGNDDIEVAGSLDMPAWLDGGAGNDQLKGGAGNDVLRGGDGDDLLL